MATDARDLCLLFRAAGERVAIRSGDVQKVTVLGHVSRLPRLPSHVAGITQHRGRVVTVVDVGRVLFGDDARASGDDARASGDDADHTPSNPDERLLILERPARHVGLRVDRVDEIEPLSLPADLPAGPSPALRIVQHRGRALPVIDLQRLARLLGVTDERARR